jgi:hypothetical protein
MLERLKKTEAQITELKRIIQREEWYGAGLSLDIYVGSRSQYEEGDKSHSFIKDLGISDPIIISSILQNILRGLENSFKIQKIFLRDQVDEIMSSGYYEVKEND